VKKYKITHKITADFIAEAIVNEDDKKPNSKFEYTMLKGSESVTQTTYEEYEQKSNNSDKERTSN
jgi:hypothetical protein